MLRVRCFRLYSKLSPVLTASICHTWYSFVCETSQFVHILKDLDNGEKNDETLYPCIRKFYTLKCVLHILFQFFLSGA